MPTRIAAPVLTVDAGKMNGIDTRNVESLFGMWTVFSKCAEYMEEGKRLENMSWRIWNRETFCCERPSQSTASRTAPSIEDFRRAHLATSVPELSASVESIASDDASRTEQRRPHSSLSPVDIQRTPLSKSLTGSQSSSRGRERHLTSTGLTKMVISIKERKVLQPLSRALAEAVSTLPSPCATLSSSPFATQPPSPSATPTQEDRPCAATPKASADEANMRRPSASSTASTAPLSSPESTLTSMKTSEIESDTSVDMLTSHSIVRGFSPSHASSYRSSSQLAPPPVPVKTPLHAKAEALKPKASAFFIGGGSSGDDESSFEDKRTRHASPGALSVALKKPVEKRAVEKKPVEKKQTSFQDEVESRSILNRAQHDDVFESDDDISESAIEDDDEDESDWEDDGTDSEPSLEEQKMFQRVDSRPNLVSRRSLLTTMIHQPDRAAALMDMAALAVPRRRSRTSTPSGPSVAASPDAESYLSTHAQIPRSQPIIMTTSNTHPPALSPRTTRRNMLATELTESLRKHLLWERQQKPTASSILLKRRHTAQDIAGATHFPTGPSTGTTSRTGSWTHAAFLEHGLGDFHERGW